MSFWICATCDVEHGGKVDGGSFGAEARQWVAADDQQWTSLDGLAASGYSTEISEIEPDLYGITSSPAAGIGQMSKLIRTPTGNLLFDPIGYIDDAGVARVRELGDVTAIVASHPHMFGVQVEWSRALDDAPVLVAEADAEWVARPDSAIRTWSGTEPILPGVTLSQPGGHFPCRSAVHWAHGADCAGVMCDIDMCVTIPICWR